MSKPVPKPAHPPGQPNRPPVRPAAPITPPPPPGPKTEVAMHRIPGQITDALAADPEGWFPDHDCHTPTTKRAPHGVRFLRRKADGRRLRAVVLQSIALLILSGSTLIGAGVGEAYANHVYDGGVDKTTSPWCWLEQPPEGLGKCRPGLTWAEVKP